MDCIGVEARESLLLPFQRAGMWRSCPWDQQIQSRAMYSHGMCGSLTLKVVVVVVRDGDADRI
jgi:hypothetical protein